jgi:hypothetical protein
MTDQENQEKNKFKEKCKRISELIKKNNEETLDLPLKFPDYPDNVKGIPNSILRSALFGAIKRGKRAYKENVEIVSTENYKIIFSGPQLDQADLDVWQHAVELTKTSPSQEKIFFSIKGFLKAIGRDTGKSQRDWLHKAFKRLSTSVVEIKDGKRSYYGGMLHKGARDEESGEYVIEINKDILKLYGSNGWTGIEWKQRFALRGSFLAQWVHGFYSTHQHSYPYSVETIHKLSGSENEDIFSFKQKLKKAFDKITAVTGWTFHIDENNLILMNKNTDNAIPFISQKKFR